MLEMPYFLIFFIILAAILDVRAAILKIWLNISAKYHACIRKVHGSCHFTLHYAHKY